MYSLVYCQDLKEYYIFKSRNVIQEDDGTCVVAFKATVVLNDGSKTILEDIRNNLIESVSHPPGDGTIKQVLENEVVEQVATFQNEDQSLPGTPSTPKEHKFTKKKYCYFCKKSFRKLVSHLIKAHRGTKAVRKLNTWSKESPQRRKIIDRIFKKSEEKEIWSRTCMQSPKFRRREITKTISHDKLIMQFDCAEYKNGKCNVKRQKNLRVLGHILSEIKKQDLTITDLSSVLTPQIIHALNKITTLTHLGTRLLYQCGQLSLNQCLYKSDLIKKKNIQEFLRLIIKNRRLNRRKDKKNSTPTTRSSNRKVHAPIVAIKKEQITDDPMKHSKNSAEKANENMKQPSIDVGNDHAKENISPNQPYLLRERSYNQLCILQMNEIYDTILSEHEKCPAPKSKKKPFYYCYFCKKIFSSHLTAHMLRKHKNEEEVLKLSSLPKSSLERRRMVNSIIKKGKSEYSKQSRESETIRLLNNQDKRREPNESLNIVAVQTDASKQDKQTVSHHNDNLDYMVPGEITKEMKEDINDNNVEEDEREPLNANGCEPFVEDYELTTTIDFKDNPLEEDTKSSLWYMLEDHVNCNPNNINK